MTAYPINDPMRAAVKADMLGYTIANRDAGLTKDQMLSITMVLGTMLDWYDPPALDGTTADMQRMLEANGLPSGEGVARVIEAMFYLIDGYLTGLCAGMRAAGIDKKFGVKSSKDVAEKLGIEFIDIVEGKK